MLCAPLTAKARINKRRLFYFNWLHFRVRLQYLVAPMRHIISLTFTSTMLIVECISSVPRHIELPRARRPRHFTHRQPLSLM